MGLLSVTTLRAEVVDFTYPVTFETNRIIGSRGIAEVDPWGFLLPLTPLVWVAILVALLGVLTVMTLSPSYLLVQTLSRNRLLTNTASCVRVLLQQGEVTYFCHYPLRS